MRIGSFGKSVKGKNHFENEDNLLIDERFRLFAVADGVTMEGGGREASQRVMKYLKESFKGDLEGAMEEMENKYVKESLKEGFKGCTTISAVHLHENLLKVCNVGDSLVFLFREGELEILTRVDKVPGTSILIQAIGRRPISIYSVEKELKEGDYIILATDGITDILNWMEIVDIVKKFKDPNAIVDEMIKEAERKFKVYDDDKTVIVIRVIEWALI